MTNQDSTGATPDRFTRLRPLGWDDLFEQRFAAMNAAPHTSVARVLSARRNRFLVSDGREERLCAPTGKMVHGKEREFPVTGDWVLTNDTVITRVVPRKNMLSRGEAGTRKKHGETPANEHPLGANIDTAFIVGGLDRDHNPRRIERFLALVYNCGITPVIVLTKADLHRDPAPFRQEIESIAYGVPVVLTSMADRSGVDELHRFFGDGRTVAMLGSSGAGKSTLANMLYGSERQATATVSDSVGKGRHTTTARELIRMPQGGMLMDNPGIREIAFHTGGNGLDTTFPDIRELGLSCRFADCAHLHEPGCAVLHAVESGKLSQSRLDSYRKMTREMEYVSERSGKSADRIEKERWRDVALRIRRMKKS